MLVSMPVALADGSGETPRAVKLSENPYVDALPETVEYNNATKQAKIEAKEKILAILEQKKQEENEKGDYVRVTDFQALADQMTERMDNYDELKPRDVFPSCFLEEKAWVHKKSQEVVSKKKTRTEVVEETVHFNNGKFGENNCRVYNYAMLQLDERGGTRENVIIWAGDDLALVFEGDSDGWVHLDDIYHGKVDAPSQDKEYDLSLNYYLSLFQQEFEKNYIPARKKYLKFLKEERKRLWRLLYQPNNSDNYERFLQVENVQEALRREPSRHLISHESSRTWNEVFAKPSMFRPVQGKKDDLKLRFVRSGEKGKYQLLFLKPPYSKTSVYSSATMESCDPSKNVYIYRGSWGEKYVLFIYCKYIIVASEEMEGKYALDAYR